MGLGFSMLFISTDILSRKVKLLGICCIAIIDPVFSQVSNEAVESKTEVKKNQKKAEPLSEDDNVTVIPTLYVSGEANSTVAGRSVLSQTLIDRIQADNVAALLDTLPGVSMAGSPRPGGQSLNIWGMGDMEDIKIIVDGARKGFEKYRQGSVFIEPEMLKRIEVNKGPHDIRFGNGGFGGVITMDTKDAGDFLEEGKQFGGLLKYSYHTNDFQNIMTGALFARTKDEKADALIYYSKRDGGNIKRPDGSKFVFSENTMDSYLAKTNIHPNEEQTFTLSAMYSTHEGWEPFAAKRDELNAPSQADIDKYGLEGAWRRRLVYRNQEDRSASVKWNYLPVDNPWIDLTLQVTHSKTKQHDTRPEHAGATASIGTLGNESWVDYVDNAIDLSNKSLFYTGFIDHELTIGAQWHKHKRDTLMYYKSRANSADYNYGYFQPYYMPSGKQQTNSLYIQDALTIGNVTITPAIRYDHVKNTGKPNKAPIYNSNSAMVGHDYSSVRYDGWSPKLGIYWQAAPSVAFFADISKTWRAPVIDEQYEVQYASATVSGSSRKLNPERIRSIRVGNILDFGSLLTDNDQLQIRTTLFQNKIKDEIFYRRGVLCEQQVITGSSSGSVCGKPLSNYRNLSGSKIEGFEIESFYDSHYWFASASYSMMKGKRKASPRDPWLGQSTWLSDIPPRKATATLGFKVPSWGFAAGWTGMFVRKQDRSPVDHDPKADTWSLPKTQGYALHGLFATWKPTFVKGVEARVTVDNLFNRNYYPYLGESVSGVGRNVKMTISKQF